MRKLLFRILVFIIMTAIVVKINLIVFLSEFPSFWGLTLILSIVGYIYFPYKTFFKKSEEKVGETK